MFVGDNDHGDAKPTDKYKEYFFSAIDTHMLQEQLHSVTKERNYFSRRLQELEEAMAQLIEEKDAQLDGAENNIIMITKDRNNLGLRVDELVREIEGLKLSLSLVQEENNELNELLAEADDNVLWLSKDVSIAEEELRLARKEICHMACSEDLFSYKGQTPVEVAYYMGWDCFKEDGNE